MADNCKVKSPEEEHGQAAHGPCVRFSCSGPWLRNYCMMPRLLLHADASFSLFCSSFIRLLKPLASSFLVSYLRVHIHEDTHIRTYLCVFFRKYNTCIQTHAIFPSLNVFNNTSKSKLLGNSSYSINRFLKESKRHNCRVKTSLFIVK